MAEAIVNWGGKRVTREQWDASLRRKAKEEKADLRGQVTHLSKEEIARTYTPEHIAELLHAAQRARKSYSNTTGAKRWEF